jgi:hypothetical protein
MNYDGGIVDSSYRLTYRHLTFASIVVVEYASKMTAQLAYHYVANICLVNHEFHICRLVTSAYVD